MSKLTDTLWDMAENIDTCMLVSTNNMALRARPMTHSIDREHNLVRFIADRRDHKDEEVKVNPDVCLTFADGSSFISITGIARIETRRDLIADHWDSRAEPWFKDGKEDPNAILIEVSPVTGEYWDGHGTLSETYELAKSSVTGDRPDAGEHKTVRF